jgi:hypothetical protein
MENIVGPVVVVPNVFLPLRTVGGRSDIEKTVYVWENLSNEGGRVLTASEKTFLCSELDKGAHGHSTDYLILPTKYQANGVGVVTLSGIFERHGISVKRQKKWLKKWRLGHLFYEVAGRPFEVDVEGINDVKRIVQNTEINQNNKMDPSSVQKLFEIERANTLKRKGIAVGDFVTFKKKKRRKKKKRIKTNNHESSGDDDEPIEQDFFGKVAVTIPLADLVLDARTVESLKTAANIKIRAAQDTTDARFTALMDPRLTYKVACGYKAWCRKHTAEYKWNADCTTIVVKPDGAGRLVCVVRGKGDKKKVESRFVVSDLNVLIKIFALGNAGGELGKLVAIVGVSSMTKDHFFATNDLHARQ